MEPGAGFAAERCLPHVENPLERTKYLLKLEGVEFEDARASESSKVPADLLEEVFELNMQLEELRQTRRWAKTIRSCARTRNGQEPVCRAAGCGR